MSESDPAIVRRVLAGDREAGVYAAIGRRLGKGGPAGVLRGGALFETASLFPVVGSLASAVVFCIALGGASLTLLEKRAVPPAPEEPAA